MSELFAAFGINWKLLLIQAFNFGILLLVLWKYLYTPVLRIIDERRQKMAEGVKNAEEAEKKLASAESEGKDIVSNASREAEGMVVAARTRAGEKEDEIIKEAESRADVILREAAARAEEVNRQMLATSARDIAKAAVLAAEKILRQKNA
ncbi:MAG: F-type H+-transporting ATPase subunit b [Parcubacteria group bacterium Gr01-1014_8]|nr:MAG: F-type H+-transporting ATPase subunit b [Parcubacteria group bacterium Gr01-1014_8]